MRYPFQAFGRVKPSTVLTKDIIGVFSVFYIHRSTFKQNSLTSLPLKGWLERLLLVCPLQIRQPWALTIVLTLITLYLFFSRARTGVNRRLQIFLFLSFIRAFCVFNITFRFVPRT